MPALFIYGCNKYIWRAGRRARLEAVVEDNAFDWYVRGRYGPPYQSSFLNNVYRIICFLILFPAVAFAAQPNVLLISIDTLRADHLGCYGSAIKTPAMDAIAKNSVLFENTISQVPLTLPSHSTIFTGLFPDQHGVRNNEIFTLQDRFQTLAELFKANGYTTGAAVGSFSLDSGFGIAQGFDYYDDQIGSGHDPEINRNVERRAETVWRIGREWLDKQKKPWFFFLHFFDPHTGYNPPAPFPQTYAGEVAYTDKVIGQIDQYLQSKKLSENTILVILSDHGEALGEHNEMTHGVFLYDSTLKVPFLIRAPQLAPKRIATQVRLVDVAPTLAQLAALRNAPKYPGQNVLQASLAEAPAYSESYYSNLLLGWAPLHSVRNTTAKWIDAPKGEFYDLKNDPGEKKNQFSNSRILPAFRAELKKHAAQVSTAKNDAVDPETREKLASLGYVTGSETSAKGSGMDPKDGIRIWSEIETAVQLAQEGKLNESKSHFEIALKLQPDNVIAQKFLANVLRKTGKDDEALRYLQSAMKSSLHQADTRSQIAELYYDRKQYAEALQQLQEVLKVEPNNRKSLRLAAFASMDMKHYPAALDYLNRLLKLEPNDASGLSARARLHSFLQQDQDALLDYRKLEEVRQLSEDEAIQVAAIYLTLRDIDSAQKYFLAVVESNKQSAEAWKGLALIYASRKQWSEATEAFLAARDCAGAQKVLQHAPELTAKYQQQCASK